MREREREATLGLIKRRSRGNDVTITRRPLRGKTRGLKALSKRNRGRFFKKKTAIFRYVCATQRRGRSKTPRTACLLPVFRGQSTGGSIISKYVEISRAMIDYIAKRGVCSGTNNNSEAGCRTFAEQLCNRTI